MTALVTKERAQALLAEDDVTTKANAGPCVDECRGDCPLCKAARRGWLMGAHERRRLARTVVAQADELARLRADAAVVARALGPEWVSGELHGDTVARLVKFAREVSRDPRAAVIAEVDAMRGEYDPTICGGDVVGDIVRRLRGESDPTMGEGNAAPREPDPVGALNAAVTAAIFRAEQLAREGSDATAAYADVARYEAALAALHPADTVEGAVAREGAAKAGRLAKGGASE